MDVGYSDSWTLVVQEGVGRGLRNTIFLCTSSANSFAFFMADAIRILNPLLLTFFIGIQVNVTAIVVCFVVRKL